MTGLYKLFNFIFKGDALFGGMTKVLVIPTMLAHVSASRSRQPFWGQFGMERLLEDPVSLSIEWSIVGEPRRLRSTLPF